MKKPLKIPYLLFAVAVFSLIFSSCHHDDNRGNSSQNTISAVNNIVTSGTWRITTYNDSGVDKTNMYSGVSFTFGSNNVLTALDSGNTINGSWSVTDSNSNDDSPNDLDFNINFSAPPKYAELSDDWDILGKTNSTIRLVDNSGGNGGTDYLTFTKN